MDCHIITRKTYAGTYYYKDPEMTILHREDGPAVEFISGDKYWYKNGELHREDGPAIEDANGYKRYYYNDKYYPNIKSDKEWEFLIKTNFVFI